jgi:hypothetical protein
VRGRVIVGVKVNGDGDDAGGSFAGCASLAWGSLQAVWSGSERARTLVYVSEILQECQSGR